MDLAGFARTRHLKMSVGLALLQTKGRTVEQRARSGPQSEEYGNQNSSGTTTMDQSHRRFAAPLEMVGVELTGWMSVVIVMSTAYSFVVCRVLAKPFATAS